MRSIGVLTSGRADYGCYLPILRRIQSDPELELRLYVTGMHLSAEYGNTVEIIEADGFPIAERVDIELASDAPEGIAHSMARALAGFGAVFARRPDVLLVLGDRFEMLAGVAAALPFNLPVAHIAGGEITEGAIDDAIRHAITKMSHLHFVAAEPYRERVIQMGEEPWRVHVTGAPSLDNLHAMKLLTRAELEAIVGMKLEPDPVLVTFHPETLDYTRTEHHAGELLAALEKVERPLVFTAPNADTSGRQIRSAIAGFVERQKRARLVVSLGTQAYFSLMKIAAAMVGNSSSGMVEAASFELPVVNLGERQRGRLHGGNVLHAATNREDIAAALTRALDPEFRAGLGGMQNPYGDGRSAERIVKVLKTADLAHILHKRFQGSERTAREAPGGVR